MILRNLARMACLAIFLLISCVRVASATHFVSGTLSWEQDTSINVDPTFKYAVKVTFDGAFRWSYPLPPPTPFNPPVGTVIDGEVSLSFYDSSNALIVTNNLPVMVTSTSAGEDLMTASGALTNTFFVSQFPITVVFSGCCRSSALAEYNHDQSYALRLQIAPSTLVSRSPEVNVPPRIYLPAGSKSSFRLPSDSFASNAADPLVNTWDWAPTASSLLVTPRPNGTAACADSNPPDPSNACTDPTATTGVYASSMKLGTSGAVEWTPSLPGLYAAQLVVTSKDAGGNPRASVPIDLQFVVVQETAPFPPLCTSAFTMCQPPSLSPTTPPNLLVQLGGQPTSASFSVSASKTVASDTVALSVMDKPAGATFTQTSGATAQGQFQWTPTAADIGLHNVCLRATGSPSGAISFGLWCATVNVFKYCLAGTYSATGDAPCTAAPVGSYVPINHSDRYFPCDPGSYSDVTGAVHCKAAPIGSFAAGLGNIAATLCAPGTYGDVVGLAACKPAPKGSYVAGYGSTSATQCNPGTYGDVVGLAACNPAPKGSYVAGYGSTSATQCAPGTYSDVTGAVACMSAPMGSFAAGYGSTSATQCNPGTYSDVIGAAACKQAPVGSFAAGYGSTSATQCNPGTYSDVAGLASCKPAPMGAYISGYGSASATQCNPGTYSDVTGAVACKQAPMGSFVAISGSTSATQCNPGTYSDVTGAVSCKLAQPGYYDAGQGNIAQTPCPVGTYSNTTGAVSCTPAPAGTYVPTTGSTAPLPCPAGTWSAPGASVCASVVTLLNQAIDAALLPDNAGLANSLRQKVAGIAAAPNANAKAGMLQAFIDHVNALRGKQLTDAQADNLIALAKLI